MRANIEIDDDMMKQAFDLSELKTKKEVVAQALKEFVQNRARKNLAELRGKIRFADGYDCKTERVGFLKGQITVPKDFDTMCAAEIAEMFDAPK